MFDNKNEKKIIASFLAGNISDAYSVLGLHDLGGAKILRAYLPEAEDCKVMPVAQGKALKVKNTLCFDNFHTWELESKPKGMHGFRVEKGDKTEDLLDPYYFPIAFGGGEGKAWKAGKLCDAQNYLGANSLTLDGVEGIIFRVWAPNALKVSVVGDFNHWNSKRHMMRLLHEYGVWEIFIPGIHDQARYKFAIAPSNGAPEILKSDPYARRAEHPPDTASVVCLNRDIEWNDGGWMRDRLHKQAPSAPISIYEVHPASWKRVGSRAMSYFEMEKELVGYVSEMGFTHIELMPVTEYPFDGSWGYQTLGMFAPTIRFGTMRELKFLINAFHRANIGVLMDWVPAHFPSDAHGLANFEGAPLYEYSDTRKGFHPDWKTHIYNYKRHEVINFLVSSALYWLEEFHFDGIRVDAVSSMLFHSYSRKEGEWEPNEYGGAENIEALAFIRNLNSLIKKRVPGAIVIAEESTAWQGVTQPVEVHGLGFDYKWNMGWMNDTLKYVKREFYDRPVSHHEITHCIDYAFTENFILPLSHDEVVHCKSAMLGKFPGLDDDKFAGLRAYYAYMWAHPGKKLLFMGNELAQWGEWDFQNELDWKLLEYDRHQGVQGVVRALNQLYKHEPCLHDDSADGFEWIKKDDANESVYAFLRKANNQQLLVVMNFSNQDYHGFRVGVDRPGGYQALLNSNWREFSGLIERNDTVIQSENISYDKRFHSLQLPLPRLSTIILKHL